MSPEAHLKKAERIERSLGRLTERDYEMRIDGAMLAATHYANMALHVLGLSVSERDIIHTEFLQVIDYKRFRVAARAPRGAGGYRGFARPVRARCASGWPGRRRTGAATPQGGAERGETRCADPVPDRQLRPEACRMTSHDAGAAPRLGRPW
jgi:hypothetical protein